MQHRTNSDVCETVKKNCEVLDVSSPFVHRTNKGNVCIETPWSGYEIDQLLREGLFEDRSFMPPERPALPSRLLRRIVRRLFSV